MGHLRGGCDDLAGLTAGEVDGVGAAGARAGAGAGAGTGTGWAGGAPD